MNRVTYEDVLSRLSGVHEYEGYSVALCVAHEETRPSMFVYGSGFVHCKSCGFGGSFVDLLKRLRGWVPPSIIEERAPTVHFLPTDLYELEQLCDGAHDFLLEYPHPLQDYLVKRGVVSRITPQNLGYHSGYYSIPIYNKDKELEGVVMRASPTIQEATGARFNIPKGQPALFYVPDWECALSNDYFCVVYGMFDALALCELGLPVGTPTSGKDSVSTQMVEWCRKPILIIPDEGEEDTARKLASKLGWRAQVAVLEYGDNDKDPADLLKHGKSGIILDGINKVLDSIGIKKET